MRLLALFRKPQEKRKVRLPCDYCGLPYDEWENEQCNGAERHLHEFEDGTFVASTGKNCAVA